VQYRAGIEDGIHAHALHEKRIGFLVEVVAPGDWRMLGGEYRMLEAVIDAVAVGHFAVAAGQQLFLLLE